MDYYTCESCNKQFDEFEMNFKMAQIDKKTLCKKCRQKLTKLNTSHEICIAKDFCKNYGFWSEMSDSLHDCPNGYIPCPDLEFDKMF